MKKINISEFNNNVNVYYSNGRVFLPKDYSDEVEKHWNSLLQSGEKFFRGDVYTITNIENSPKGINIFVRLTDYAHFLYTINKNTYSEYDCRVIHTSVLIETSDGKFVLGEMSRDTAFPNALQFIGGDDNFLSAIYKINLLIDENQFLDMFNNYKQKLISKGQSPEINSLIFIQADPKAVEQFINNDTRKKDCNVIPTLMVAAGITPTGKFIEL